MSQSLHRGPDGYFIMHLHRKDGKSTYSCLEGELVTPHISKHTCLPSELSVYLNQAYDEFRSVEHVKSWTRDEEDWVRSHEGFLRERLAEAEDVAGLKGGKAFINLRDSGLGPLKPVTRQMLDGQSDVPIRLLELIIFYSVTVAQARAAAQYIQELLNYYVHGIPRQSEANSSSVQPAPEDDEIPIPPQIIED